MSNHLACELRGEVQVLSPYGTWGAVPGWVAPVRADAGATATLSFPVTVPATAQPGSQSWLLVKLMYFGRVRYSGAVPFTVTPITRALSQDAWPCDTDDRRVRVIMGGTPISGHRRH